METRFQVGDVLVRSAYKDSKSKVMRDEQRVVAIESDEHPICPQTFYTLIDFRGKVAHGLQSIMEECFEKVN